MRGGRSKVGGASTISSMLVVLRASDANGRISVYEKIEREHGAAFARLVRSEFEKSIQPTGKRT